MCESERERDCTQRSVIVKKLKLLCGFGVRSIAKAAEFWGVAHQYGSSNCGGGGGGGQRLYIPRVRPVLMCGPNWILLCAACVVGISHIFNMSINAASGCAVFLGSLGFGNCV